MSAGNLNEIRYHWWKNGRRDLGVTALLGAQNYARSIDDDETVQDIEAWFAEYDEKGK